MPDSRPLPPAGVLEEPQAPTPQVASDDPFSSLTEKFDRAAGVLGLAPDAYSVLRVPDREARVQVPVQLPDGAIHVFAGWRIQHNLSLGPCLGRLMLDRNLQPAGLRALAAWMTWNCAALGVPFGGSIGAIDLDPREHGGAVTEKAVRRYTASLLDLIGPERDVLMPGVHCDERVMAWALDTYAMHVRHTDNAVVVGKPLGLGGTLGGDTAIARGARAVMEAHLERIGHRGRARVAIQGSGYVGAQVARELVRRGHSVVAFGDLRGGVYNPRGLDVEACLSQRALLGTVSGAPVGDALDAAAVLEAECDVLIPASTSGVLTQRIAQRVRTKMVVEAANAPTTAAAEHVLTERGIPVVPDLLGNGGSIIIAYFEWVQNRIGYAWTEEQVNERLERMLLNAYQACVAVAEERRLDLRLATCISGIRRVAYFDALRGIYA